jgi:hypothetical protein
MMHPETHIRTARITHAELETFNAKQYRQMKADEKARVAREKAWSKPLLFGRAPRGTLFSNARRTLLGWI